VYNGDNPEQGFFSKKTMNRIQHTFMAGMLIPLLGFMPALDRPIQEAEEDPSSTQERLVFMQTNTLLPIASPLGSEKIAKTMRLYVTAYSSTPEQTDDTPFITASGKHVRDGIVATNLLPLGTKIKIPEIYGNKVFVVEDRMHPRMQDRVDIWFSTYSEAKNFGKKRASIVVLEG
jgi:3D (Asp-Asp-Asp) domain-containing protein